MGSLLRYKGAFIVVHELSLWHVGCLVVARGLSSCGAGSVAPQHVGSSIPNQESNFYLLYYKADSQQLGCEKVPRLYSSMRTDTCM